MATSHSTEIDIRLAAARNGDQSQFAALVEPYQHEIKVHCYRMLGSMQDAEDMLQETMLRAWRRLNTFEGRASFRAWVYKIATNICLDELKKRKRKGLPTTFQAPANPEQPPQAPIQEPIWLEPCSAEFLGKLQLDEPTLEAKYSQRESVSLAFLVALQTLPAKQRAVLLLREVLAMRANEVANILDISLSGVNSALYRARNTLGDNQAATPDPSQEISETLQRYLHAWENADVNGLISLLKDDVAFAMPPVPSWFQGRTAVRLFLSGQLLAGDAGGRWRLHPTSANAQPAFAFYRKDPASESYLPFGIHVLTMDGNQIQGMTHFLFEGLFTKFSLPEKLT